MGTAKLSSDERGLSEWRARCQAVTFQEFWRMAAAIYRRRPSDSGRKWMALVGTAIAISVPEPSKRRRKQGRVMARVTDPPDLVRTLAAIRDQLRRIPIGSKTRASDFDFLLHAAVAMARSAAYRASVWGQPVGEDVSIEPTTTPEDTLRDAGVDDARQANYQRRLSVLLAGTATA